MKFKCCAVCKTACGGFISCTMRLLLTHQWWSPWYCLELQYPCLRGTSWCWGCHAAGRSQQAPLGHHRERRFCVSCRMAAVSPPIYHPVACWWYQTLPYLRPSGPLNEHKGISIFSQISQEFINTEMNDIQLCNITYWKKSHYSEYIILYQLKSFILPISKTSHLLLWQHWKLYHLDYQKKQFDILRTMLIRYLSESQLKRLIPLMSVH